MSGYEFIEMSHSIQNSIKNTISDSFICMLYESNKWFERIHQTLQQPINPFTGVFDLTNKKI